MIINNEPCLTCPWRWQDAGDAYPSCHCPVGEHGDCDTEDDEP